MALRTSNSEWPALGKKKLGSQWRLIHSDHPDALIGPLFPLADPSGAAWIVAFAPHALAGSVVVNALSQGCHAPTNKTACTFDEGRILSSLTNSGGGHDRGTSKTKRLFAWGASVIGLLAAAPEARAQDMQQIQAQINEMQATIQALQKQVQDAKAQAAAANATAANAGGSDLDLKVKWKGAPELSSVDGKYSFKVRGRLMVDYNGIDQDEPITGEGDINAVELRRARLGVEGVVYYDWKYKFEIEFAGDAVEIKDAYLAYANWWGAIDTSEIRIGNQYVYTSLEQITSSRFITFLERAAFTEAFLPSVEADRQIGAAILVGDEHWSLQTGAYGASVGAGQRHTRAGRV